MKINRRKESLRTHEGAKAKRINPELQLRRSVLACMLWEKTFYEDGLDIAFRIADLVPAVSPQKVKDLAIEARERMKLRHVPLLLSREMLKHKSHKLEAGETIARVIQRPDELTEFLSIYWKDGKTPIAAQAKRGLAKAFTKFDAYQLAKYNRQDAIKLRDVMFLVHPKPLNSVQEETWSKLAKGTLESPDTWEVALSSGGDKKAHWERLLSNRKLGGMALLRNLRNFQKVGVDESLVEAALEDMNVERILPYRFITAARYAPDLEPILEKSMLKCLEGQEPLSGETVVLLDVSGSMQGPISAKSEMTCQDAACGMAILLRSICEKVKIYTFSLELVKVPSRTGFALRDAVIKSQHHMGTLLGEATRCVYASKDYKPKYDHSSIKFQGQALNPDRLIVFTDEQSHDPVPDPQGRAYMINVSSYQNGVGYGPWHHVDGWSESIIDYIKAYEKEVLIT